MLGHECRVLEKGTKKNTKKKAHQLSKLIVCIFSPTMKREAGGLGIY